MNSPWNMMLKSPQFPAAFHAVEVPTNAESNFNLELTFIGPHGALMSTPTLHIIDLSALLTIYYFIIQNISL
jgi:hypothetical protein